MKDVKLKEGSCYNCKELKDLMVGQLTGSQFRIMQRLAFRTKSPLQRRELPCHLSVQ